MEADGKFVHQSGGRCVFGRVRVRCVIESSDETAVPRVEPSADLLACQDWPTEWVEAAVSGASIGIQSAGTSCRCVIIQLHDPALPPGTIRQWAIALAAVRAVWAAVGFKPDPTVEAYVEKACGLPEYARRRVDGTSGENLE